MQKTLLQHVKDIEQEAQQLIEQARSAAQEYLEHTQRSELRSKQELAAKADATAHALVEEYRQKAIQEAGETKQQTKHVEQQIHKTAEQNRKRTLAYATRIFFEEYKL